MKEYTPTLKLELDLSKSNSILDLKGCDLNIVFFSHGVLISL